MTAKEKQEELLKMHGDKPLEWWAKQLVTARSACMEAKSNYKRLQDDIVKERETNYALTIIADNSVKLARDRGYPVTVLRVTQKYTECVNDYCDDFIPNCSECEYSECHEDISLLHAYDYMIDTGNLHVVTAQLKNDARVGGVKKIEDVTNPHQSITLWEEKVDDQR